MGDVCSSNLLFIYLFCTVNLQAQIQELVVRLENGMNSRVEDGGQPVFFTFIYCFVDELSGKWFV